VTDPAASIGSSLANRALGSERWARESLAKHAGRTFRVTVGPVASVFAIGDDGTLAPAPADAGVPDLELALSPLAVPALLADPSCWPRVVVATGEPALAATLQDLAQTLPWFVERAFASVLGPIAGQRVADAGRALLAFPGYASSRLAGSVGSFARDEAGLLPSGAEGRAFGAGVADLAARVDALDERLARIAASIAARGPRPV